MFQGRAWKVVRFGDPLDALEIQDIRLPDPKSGQVLVRVRTAGAGFPDFMMTKGQYPLLKSLPIGLGTEAAGDVVAVPSGSAFKVGDRVMGITGFLEGYGGYAEYTYLREQSSVRVSSSLSDEQAGGFPIGFRTAYAGLVERTSLKPGEILLVLGAAGSVGSAAVQLGKALGATVIAVAGTAGKLDFITRFGADHVINYKAEDLRGAIARLTNGRGVDLVYDPVGGTVAAEAVAGLARNGRIAVVGLASGATVQLSSLDLLIRNCSAVGVLASGYTPQEDAIAWKQLSSLIDRGAITVPVGTVYGFMDVPRMIEQQVSPPPGKSVLRVS